MATLKNILAFQIRFGAITLPKMKSIAFIKTGFGNKNVNDIATVWLDHQTAEKLTVDELAEINGHYDDGHPVAINTATSLPSQRKRNAYVSYEDNQLYFSNGRHRTRLYLEGGAPYIPFDISIQSVANLQRDGYACAAFDVACEYAEKQALLHKFEFIQNPFDAALQTASPNKLTLDGIVDASRLFFKLAAQEVSSLKRRNELEAQTDYIIYDNTAHKMEVATRRLGFIKEILPVLMKMREAGMELWPSDIYFPALLPAIDDQQAERTAKWKEQVIKATGLSL